MATAQNGDAPKLTQKELAIIIAGVEAQVASMERKSAARGIDSELKAIYDRKAGEARNVLNRLTTGELFR